MTATESSVTAAPKVLLHDHLDGGLRPATLIELANEPAFRRRNPDFALPSNEPAELAALIQRGANSGSLVEYLKPFDYTTAVMQTPEQLHRVAAECVADLAADGVVYAESRFAPIQHLQAGLTESAVVAAVLAGFEQGMADARAAGTPIEVRALICAMRHLSAEESLGSARVAIEFHGKGVVGFDIAGPENGFPPQQHAAAFSLLREHGVPITIHAGEAAGVDSITGALAQGARRLGHGVRIVEDIRDGVLGDTATQVRNEHIALETCPCSNVHTLAVPSRSEHPLRYLLQQGFAATINTDNRLMSGTSMSAEFSVALAELGLSAADLRTLTFNAMQAAFCDEATKSRLLTEVLEPAWDRQ